MRVRSLSTLLWLCPSYSSRLMLSTPFQGVFLSLFYRECRALTQCYEYFLKLAPANKMQLNHINMLSSECAQAREYHSHQVHITPYCSLNCAGCCMQRINWRTTHHSIHLYFFPNFFSPLIYDILVS